MFFWHKLEKSFIERDDVLTKGKSMWLFYSTRLYSLSSYRSIWSKVTIYLEFLLLLPYLLLLLPLFFDLYMFNTLTFKLILFFIFQILVLVYSSFYPSLLLCFGFIYLISRRARSTDIIKSRYIIILCTF